MEKFAVRFFLLSITSTSNKDDGAGRAIESRHAEDLAELSVWSVFRVSKEYNTFLLGYFIV
jgi:hypothetical protein